MNIKQRWRQEGRTLSQPTKHDGSSGLNRGHGQIVLRLSIMADNTGKNSRFPLLDILGYLKNIHKNPKFGKVRQVPTREFPTKFPGWDLSHSSKFGIFVGIL